MVLQNLKLFIGVFFFKQNVFFYIHLFSTNTHLFGNFSNLFHHLNHLLIYSILQYARDQENAKAVGGDVEAGDCFLLFVLFILICILQESHIATVHHHRYVLYYVLCHTYFLNHSHLHSWPNGVIEVKLRRLF
jgi:hypothetical protein